MAMKTWQVSVKWQGNLTRHKFKCAEKDARHLDHEISSLIDIRQSSRALKGYTDEPGVLERGYMTSFSYGGDNGPGNPVANPEQWQADTRSVLALLPQGDAVGDGKLAKAIAAEAGRLFFVHLPIVDKRVDRQKEQDDKIKYQQSEIDRSAEQAALQAEFAAAWAERNELIEIPAGMQAVVLTLNYDNSDAMTDYFAPHCNLPGSKPLLLQWADAKHARTEALAREALAHFPWVMKLSDTRYVEDPITHRRANAPTTQPISFDWYTKNYSGGHGNYLESGMVFEYTLHPGTKYEKTVGVTLEVEFTTYTHDKLLPCKRG